MGTQAEPISAFHSPGNRKDHSSLPDKEMKPISQRIADDMGIGESRILAAIRLLDEGATVPFIARYRKEATGELSDTHLRHIHARLGSLRDLDGRRETVLRSIRDQGKLTPQLERELLEADTRTRLEDLYLPYRPQRRTKASTAREAGLEPLARHLLDHPSDAPEIAARQYVDRSKGIADEQEALEGARHILADILSEEAELVGRLRELLWKRGLLRARVVKGKEAEGAKFADYFDFGEPISTIPSHRALALFRGKSEGILRLSLEQQRDNEQASAQGDFYEQRIAQHFQIRDRGRPGDPWLLETVHQAWRKKLRPHLETELTKRVTGIAHEEAIRVFANNLQDLLMAAPAGTEPVIGLDPGLRTGVKVAVVDGTGKVVETDTIYPHPPRKQWQDAMNRLEVLARRHGARLVSIGNGTASRETERLLSELQKARPELRLTRVVVSEAGASVYSASEYASQELPDMDVSLRGAVSIARRLQDPLAELVKIDPKSIGVGQYQHDLDARRLAESLDSVVEDAVNAVGVDVNTASVPLLERVSGLTRTLARNIVAYREEAGPFRMRKTLNKIPKFGPKAFEQAAGFLRIRNGDTPLDASAVHPESYPVVERILRRTGLTLSQLIGNGDVLKTLSAADFVDERFGEPTVLDILGELEKPGRDPRPEFRTATFKEGIESLDDLQPGMVLEGMVTNVTNFGAFVDVGVHQDGLVHISKMAERYVKDPHDITRAGSVVKVRVLDVDLNRRRIALSMRLDEAPVQGSGAERSSASATKKSYAMERN